MRLSESLNSALNQQVLHEYRNMLIYKQIESFFEDLQLKKLSKYFSKQSQHEKDHGDKFVQYINDRTGGKVICDSVIMPELPYVSLDSIANIYIATEEQTTASIEEIFDLSLSEKSYIDLPFLQSMLSEQVEEEDGAQEFYAKIKMVKDIVLFDATFGE